MAGQGGYGGFALGGESKSPSVPLSQRGRRSSGFAVHDNQVAVAHQAVQTILGELEASLRRGEKIEIRGFGSFRQRRRRPRTGRNPRTGASVQVPAKRVIHFKPGRLLLDLLNH